MRRIHVFAAALVVAVGLVTTGVEVSSGAGQKHFTAYFDHAVGVYAGSDLRVLGVKVGTVNSVQPQGTQVKVSLTLDAGVRIPAGAGAVVVAPSVVSDRYIQLSPAYTGGPELADHAQIPIGRTATPVEIDQLYQSITQLSDALGPNGANATGALSRLLDTGAQNLDGNGQAIGDTIAQLGQASRTLSDHSGDLFATLSYLQSFTTMLKDNDTKVRAATDQLSTVSGFLAADRQDLGAALQQLATALGQVKGFIQDNRARLKSSIDKLTPITQTLVDQRASLAELLDTAPLAVDNALSAYDPAYGTLDGRANLNELSGQSVLPLPLPLPLPGVGTLHSTGSTTGAAR
ncbi:MCE family protein [Kitasatospora sp. MAP5-34]|uniref:MCE family protein n=1 Tax=Kitasatospora sp. MAP5-34 TaxID=3035102 RepID=UPI0024760D82|nr:MCE family protein [Kitasatospora sp. MAP5-34]MDH6577242.1 phospholipid/cholesterol/gamma-HCH transport system substrate-binding protein [Kitasatospora sp. MAP5-34]